MNKTRTNNTKIDERILVTTPTLTAILDCGRDTAVRIGLAAGARVQIGKRVLWSTSKVRNYIDTIVTTNHIEGGAMHERND